MEFNAWMNKTDGRKSITNTVDLDLSYFHNRTVGFILICLLHISDPFWLFLGFVMYLNRLRDEIHGCKIVVWFLLYVRIKSETLTQLHKEPVPKFFILLFHEARIPWNNLQVKETLNFSIFGFFNNLFIWD